MPPDPVTHGRRRSEGRHRPAPGWSEPNWFARLVAVGALSLLPTLILVVAAQTAATTGSRSPTGLDRFVVASSWLGARADALVGYHHWLDVSPVGFLQLGLLNRMLGGGTAQTVVAAFRGELLLVGAATAALTWLLTRRIGASALASFAGATAAGATPLAATAHGTPSVAAVAVMWLLVAANAVLARRDLHWWAVLAGATTAVGVATLPILAPAAGMLWWALARRSGRGLRSPAAVAAAVFVVVALAFGTVGAVLASGAPTADARGMDLLAATGAVPLVGLTGVRVALTADPLLIVVGAICVVACLRHPLTRPLAALTAVLAAATIVPFGADAASGAVVVLPAVAVVVAIAVDDGVLALGRPSFVVSFIGSGVLMGVAAWLVVGTVVAASRATAVPQHDATRAAVAWVESGSPAGQRVLVDLGSWPDAAASAGRDGRAPVGWLVGDGGVLRASSAPAAAGYVVTASARARATVERLTAAVPVITVASGGATATVLAVPATPLPPGPQAAWIAAGRQAARNTKLVLSGTDRALLAAGAVDTRIATVLQALTSSWRITVGAFPGSGARHSVLITGIDGRQVPEDSLRTGALLHLLSGLPADQAPTTLQATARGVEATFG